MLMTGGTVTLNKEAQNIFMSGGYLETPWGSSGKVLNLRQTGGVFRHHSTNGAANVTQASVGNCTYDLGRGAKTIDHLIRRPGLKLLQNDMHTITLETTLDQVSEG
jgi:hypothetical protein